MMTERVYIVRPAMFAPVILSVVAVVFAVQESWWYLVALPAIWLGSICAQPNANLVNGCLAYLTMMIGVAVIGFFRPLGIAIFFGATSGFYFSVIEKRVRARPYLIPPTQVEDRIGNEMNPSDPPIES